MARGYIHMGVPRAMVSYVRGARPGQDVKSKSFLPEGGLFVNFVDNVLCVGTGRGGWVEYELPRLKVVDEPMGSR